MFLPFAFKPLTAIGKGHGGLQNCKAAAWYVGKRIVGIGRHGETKNRYHAEWRQGGIEL